MVRGAEETTALRGRESLIRIKYSIGVRWQVRTVCVGRAGSVTVWRGLFCLLGAVWVWLRDFEGSPGGCFRGFECWSTGTAFCARERAVWGVGVCSQLLSLYDARGLVG